MLSTSIFKCKIVTSPSNGKIFLFQIVEYPGAGHLLEPPYSPFCEASYHPMAGIALLWGGNAKDHCAAQVQSWNKILHFFKTKLA